MTNLSVQGKQSRIFFFPRRGQGSRDSLTQESFTLNKLPEAYQKKKTKEEEDKRGQHEKL